MPDIKNTTVNSDTESLLDFAKDMLGIKITTVESMSGKQIPLIARPGGMAIESLKKFADEYLEKPERIKGMATHMTLQSFIDHVNRFKGDNAAIYAIPDAERASLTAIFDYHNNGKPDWLGHKSFYKCPVSEEWTAWNAKDSEPMSQGEFAEFITARALDIVPFPKGDSSSAANGLNAIASALNHRYGTPTEIFEVARGIAINESNKAKSIVNIQSGEMALQYETEHSGVDGQRLKVPGLFLIGIPVFKGGAPYRIPCRLRYRLKEKVVSWSYDIYRPDRVFDDAFAEVCTTAKYGTSLPVFMGASE